jgi:hypothetical protein
MRGFFASLRMTSERKEEKRSKFPSGMTNERRMWEIGKCDLSSLMIYV